MPQNEGNIITNIQITVNMRVEININFLYKKEIISKTYSTDKSVNGIGINILCGVLWIIHFSVECVRLIFILMGKILHFLITRVIAPIMLSLLVIIKEILIITWKLIVDLSVKVQTGIAKKLEANRAKALVAMFEHGYADSIIKISDKTKDRQYD